MDIVVENIPPKYGMLLSRSWGAKLRGSLQLDMSYATISVFGQPKRLYRETLMKYLVSSQEKPENFPVYSVHSDMDSFILYNAEFDLPTELEAPEKETANKTTVQIEEISENKETPDNQEIPEKIERPKPPVKKHVKTVDEDYEHENLWHLEFDGSVNKLGAGAGI